MIILDARKDSGCDYHRVQMPMKHMTGLNLKRPTLFINRDTRHTLDYIRKLKREGGRFVYDLDDTHSLPDSHPLALHYRTEKVQQRFAALFELADCVTVTTTRLAEEFRHMTKAPIEVLPNALPFDRGQFTRSTDTVTGRPIVWAGGSSHEVDLALVREVIQGRDIALAGYQRMAPWYAMVQMFPGCAVKPAFPVRAYMNHYDGHRIAIAPLVASPFAECKSNLKILEAGAKGLPIIASRTAPYWRGRNMPGVLFAKDDKDWLNLTQTLLADPELCKERGEQLAAHVRENYHLDTVNQHRRQILEG